MTTPTRTAARLYALVIVALLVSKRTQKTWWKNAIIQNLLKMISTKKVLLSESAHYTSTGVKMNLICVTRQGFQDCRKKSGSQRHKASRRELFFSLETWNVQYMPRDWSPVVPYAEFVSDVLQTCCSTLGSFRQQSTAARKMFGLFRRLKWHSRVLISTQHPRNFEPVSNKRKSRHHSYLQHTT